MSEYTADFEAETARKNTITKREKRTLVGRF